MTFDYKKEYKEFYMPKGTPSIVRVPKMNYIAVRGSGNPNDADGEYKQSIGLLYGIAFTIKMSKKEDHQIDGYFDYVVPPLEGFWWQEGVSGIDYARKEEFKWISVIRLPDFVSREDFDWAVRKATEKKNQDFSKVEFFSYDEGLCVQCMHIGSYDDEPATVDEMHRFMELTEDDLNVPEVTEFVSEIRRNFIGDLYSQEEFRQKPLVIVPEVSVNENLENDVETMNNLELLLFTLILPIPTRYSSHVIFSAKSLISNTK